MTDALVSELRECATREIEQRSWTGWHSDHPAMKAADAIARLTRELGEARRAPIDIEQNILLARARKAEAERDAARRELAACRDKTLEEAANVADQETETGSRVYADGTEIAMEIRALKTEA